MTPGGSIGRLRRDGWWVLVVVDAVVLVLVLVVVVMAADRPRGRDGCRSVSLGGRGRGWVAALGRRYLM